MHQLQETAIFIQRHLVNINTNQTQAVNRRDRGYFKFEKFYAETDIRVSIANSKFLQSIIDGRQ